MTLTVRGVSSGAAVLIAFVLAAEAVSGQASAVGTWNLQTRNIAMRATGGVRNVLLKVEDVDGALHAQMTSPRNTFLDVSDFQVDGSSMRVSFGAYIYELEMREDRLIGRMMSPVDTLEVEGTRQRGLMFGGDRAAIYVATRTGPLGHSTELLPPEGTADPGEWVRSRLESVDDIALVLRGIPVLFVNASDFEDELIQFAGQTVDVTGEWVSERYRIHEIALAEPDGR